MEATPAFPGRGVPGSSPAFVPPASVHKAAMAQRPGQRGPSAAWVYRQLQKCLCLTPAGLRSTEVTQGQCSAELTMNSEEIPWLELCLPSFFICPDCFFSLGFRSSRTQGFICLQTFLFSPSDLVLQLQRSSRHRDTGHPWRAQEGFCFQVKALPFHFFNHHPFHDAHSLSSTQMSQADPEAPKDGALGFSQEISVGSWKLGLQSKKEFFLFHGKLSLCLWFPKGEMEEKATYFLSCQSGQEIKSFNQLLSCRGKMDWNRRDGFPQV